MAASPTLSSEPNSRLIAQGFYREVLASLIEAGIPYLVGGAFALRHYTGIERDTKDLDLFLRLADQERAMTLFERAGYQTEWKAPHWLTKIFFSHQYADLIFGLANGIGTVTDTWFSRAPDGTIFDQKVRLVPMEEMIWSKAFIMERDRFDGADINHILRAQSDRLDWPHLVGLFGDHWRVLLSHLILFGYVYPAEAGRIPAAVLRELLQRLESEPAGVPGEDRLCRGPLLARSQYTIDLERDHYADARLAPYGALTPKQADQ